MKKYLMTGIAALAMIAGFTSCSSNDDAFDYEGNAALTVKTYQENFIKVFGKPAANQTWGFGTAVTRGTIVNVNGNQWTEMPGVTAAEKQLVFNHVNKDKSQVVGATEVFPHNLQNYFVTHVWTGGDTYSTFDGTSTGILGSGKMNNLQIAESSSATITNGDLSATGWFHVNNFNRGDNTDWSGNTLVTNSGTFDFAYHSSDDSNYHNKWIAVPGSAIDASLAGYYYICFDFYSCSDEAETVFRGNFTVNGETKNGEMIVVPGAWNSAAEAIAAGVTTAKYDYYDWRTQTTTKVDVPISTSWNRDQVRRGNECIPANNVYTDWIIRLVEAQPAGNPALRVFAEDLSATEKSDFDFNDVVFDAEYVSASNVKVTILAAGGTLPLRLMENDNYEVHGALAAQNPTKANQAVAWDKEKKDWVTGLPIKTTTMINTEAERIYPEHPLYQAIDGLNAFTFNITNYTDWSNDINEFSGQVRDRIKVEVNKGGWIELTAPVGAPACKVAVPIKRAWSPEKVSLGQDFANYVIDNDYKWYLH